MESNPTCQYSVMILTPVHIPFDQPISYLCLDSFASFTSDTQSAILYL